MNYKNTIKSSLMLYPNIFPNHFAVAEHLFATVGNGYGWVDGELICGNQKIPTEDEAIKKAFEFRFNNYRKNHELLITIKTEQDNSYNVYEYPLKRFNSDVLLIGKVSERFDDYKHKSEFIDMVNLEKVSVYPISNFSSLVDFPNDIKSDWKEAMLKFINYILNNRDIINEDYNNTDEQIKLLEKSKFRLINLQ